MAIDVTVLVSRASDVVDPRQQIAPVDEGLLDEADHRSDVAQREIEHRSGEPISIPLTGIRQTVKFGNDPLGIIGKLTTHTRDDLVGEQVPRSAHHNLPISRRGERQRVRQCLA